MYLKQIVLFLIFFICFAQTQEEMPKVRKALRIANEHYTKKEFQQALKVLDEILENPLENPILFKREKVLAFEKREEDFYKEIMKSHFVSNLYSLRGKIKFRIQKEFVQALDDFNHAITLCGLNLSSKYINRSQVKQCMGDFKGALESYNQALLLFPDEYEIYIFVGILNIRLNQPEKAFECFNKAFSLSTAIEEEIRLFLLCSLYFVQTEEEFLEIKNIFNFSKDHKDEIEFRTILNVMDEILEYPTENLIFFKQSQFLLDESEKYLDKKFVKSLYLANLYALKGKIKFKIQQDFENALEDFSYAISLGLPLIYNYSNRGQIKQKMGDFKGALEDYNHAILLFPHHSHTYISRGVLNVRSNLQEKAFEDFNKAFFLSTSKMTLFFLSSFYFVQTEEELLKIKNIFLSFHKEYKYGKEYRTTLKVMNEVLENPTKNLIFFKQKSQNLEDSKKYLDEKIITSLYLANLYALKGNAKFDHNEFVGALEDFSYAISLGLPLISNYINRGQIKQKTGDFKGALQDYNQAILLFPNHYQVYIYRGVVNRHLNQLKSALEDFNKALSLSISDEDTSEAYAYRSSIKERLGNLKESLEDSNISIKLYPSVLNYSCRADLKYEMGDLVGALEDYNSAIKLDSEGQIYTGTYINRGDFYYKIQDFSNAKKDYQKYLELNHHIEGDFIVERNRKHAQEKLFLLQYD
jgi:tetratricopeptide (TPR) repeat protein